ncbi:MAG: hypothetical protein RSB48_08310, partial [Akkermansia sp.]
MKYKPTNEEMKYHRKIIGLTYKLTNRHKLRVVYTYTPRYGSKHHEIHVRDTQCPVARHVIPIIAKSSAKDCYLLV